MKIVDAFLADVYTLGAGVQCNEDAHLSTRRAIRLVFSFFDKHLHASEFDVCDAALQRVDLHRINDAVATGFLAITLPAKSKLPNRAALLARIKENLQTRRPEDVESLLQGLK